FAHFVFFQQVPELAHRGLVRHRLTAQINAHELPHHPRVVQRLFYRRVRQVEPLLQKVNPQHALYSHRWPPVPRLGIMRRHQRAQLAPRHHLLHLLQKYRSPPLPSVLLKAGHHPSRPLFPPSAPLTSPPLPRRALTHPLLTPALFLLPPSNAPPSIPPHAPSAL